MNYAEKMISEFRDAERKYSETDAKVTRDYYEMLLNSCYGVGRIDCNGRMVTKPMDYSRFYCGSKFDIDKVVFHNPATIVFWKDGTKTVVKCGENDIYDPEKGLAMAMTKKALGNKGNYYNKLKEWLPVDYKPTDLTYTGHNALVFVSLEEAIANGCTPCKHCQGKHEEEQ